MNVLKMYSIHDAAVAAFVTPFFAANDVAAIRLFTGLVNDPQSTYSISPGDFTLYNIGSFDIMTGNVTADELRKVRNGLALVRQLPLVGVDQEELNLDTAYGMSPTTGDINHG